MHKNRKIRAGRPSKEKQQEGAKISKSSDDENEYIADDSDCEKLFQLIARQSSYKNITKTGPNKGKRQDENLIAQAADKARDKLKELNMEDVQFFFLSNRKRVFEFQNDKLIDKTNYSLIKEEDFAPEMRKLIHKINIVGKELEESFMEVLTSILKLYQDCRHMDEETQTKMIIQHIRDPQNQKQFQYILNWEILKNITKETRMARAFEDLEEKEGEIQKKSSQKVKTKHLDFIKSQQKELEEEKEQEPLDYLVSKLVMIFNNIQN